MDFVPYAVGWRDREHLVCEAGYIRVNIGSKHPHHNKGYVTLHRLVMEAHLGRYLEPSEVVHHINEVKNDNRLMNLYLCTQEEHVQIHNRGSKHSLKRRSQIRKGVIASNKRKNQKIERKSGS